VDRSASAEPSDVSHLDRLKAEVVGLCTKLARMLRIREAAFAVRRP